VLGLGADEMQIVIGEDFGEAGVLRQKAVARMHGIDAGDLAGRKQGGDVEVGVLGRWRTDAYALVGKPHMHGIVIRGGMHRHGCDAEFLAGAQDAKCDLAAIGYEDLVEHVSLFAIRSYSIITSGSPNSTGWPSSTRICVTVPARGEGI